MEIMKGGYPVQQTIADFLLQILAFRFSRAVEYSFDPRASCFQLRRSVWKLGQLVIDWHFTPALQEMFCFVVAIFVLYINII